jgi:hypothetical protein
MSMYMHLLVTAYQDLLQLTKSDMKQGRTPSMRTKIFGKFSKKETLFFFSNDLTRRVHYTNTSFKVYGKPPEKKWYHSRFPASSWTLPYRAAIVWPIQQLESDSLQFEALGCIGFLAVDCARPNSFRKQLDVPLGAGIGDALYHCFVVWNALRLRIGSAGRRNVDG